MNVLRRPVFWIFLCAGLPLSTQAKAAGCVVTLALSNVNVSWNLNFTYQAITFTVTKTSDPACDYGIGFSRGSAPDYNRYMTGITNVPLSYQLYQDSSLTQILKYAGDMTGPTDAILGQFGAGSVASQTLTYYVAVPLGLATAPAIKPYGTYSDTFNVSAYEGTDPTQFITPITTTAVNLSVTLPKIVQLSIGSSGASFDPAAVSNTVNFGTLSSGVVAQRDLLVRTNAGYSVTFTSANHGVMVQANPSISTTVPYTFMINGAAIDLTQGASAPTAVSGQTSLAGDRNPVLIQVGNIQTGMAGTYSDTISISVSSTD